MGPKLKRLWYKRPDQITTRRGAKMVLAAVAERQASYRLQRGDMPKLEPEGSVNVNKLIKDHPFRTEASKPWGQCIYRYTTNGARARCGLAQAAHAETLMPYKVKGD